jgi:hypothetical protein
MRVFWRIVMYTPKRGTWEAERKGLGKFNVDASIEESTKTDLWTASCNKYGCVFTTAHRFQFVTEVKDIVINAFMMYLQTGSIKTQTKKFYINLMCWNVTVKTDKTHHLTHNYLRNRKTANSKRNLTLKSTCTTKNLMCCRNLEIYQIYTLIKSLHRREILQIIPRKYE